MSATPPLAPVRSTRRLRLLDGGQLGDRRAGTLEILETVGVDATVEGEHWGIPAAADAEVVRA